MRLVAGLFLAATLAALTACSGAAEPARRSVTPTATAEPVFASEEEALAAAEEAYREYLRVSDEIARDGGRDAERIRDHVAPSRLGSDLAVFAEYEAQGLRLRGDTHFQSEGLQQHSQSADGEATVVIYGCWDASGAVIENVDGENVTPENRQESLSLEITLVSASLNSSRLVLFEEAQWSGDDFCL